MRQHSKLCAVGERSCKSFSAAKLCTTGPYSGLFKERTMPVFRARFPGFRFQAGMRLLVTVLLGNAEKAALAPGREQRCLRQPSCRAARSSESGRFQPLTSASMNERSVSNAAAVSGLRTTSPSRSFAPPPQVK